MSTAPSIAEQYALYVEMFAFASGSLVLFALGVVVNWRVVRNMDELIGNYIPKSIRGIELQKPVMDVLAQWGDEFRRVRRAVTFMFGVALLGLAFANSTIITIAGSHLRNDGVVSQWQRWAAYTFYMLLSTVGMAEYYALDPVPTWLLGIIPGTAGMAMGVFVSLTSDTGDGYADKVANLSVWGGVLIMALVPLFYLYTNYSILRRWWRGFPIVVHVLFALLLWVILWTGPEVAGEGSKFSRVVAAWFYFAVVLLWTLADLAMVYFWRMGIPKQRTSATDATPSITVDMDEVEEAAEARGLLEKGRGGEAIRGPGHQVVNLNPDSPHYATTTPAAAGWPLQYHQQHHPHRLAGSATKGRRPLGTGRVANRPLGRGGSAPRHAGAGGGTR